MYKGKSEAIAVKSLRYRVDCEGRLTPVRELQMMRWMNVVIDKENWDVKVIMNRFLMGKGRR